MTAPGKLEAAFGADLAADPLSWTWTDLTVLTEDNAVTIRRGRSSAGAGQTEPASATFALRNGGGDSGVTVGSLSPRKATGDWYPDVRRGLPVRHSVNTGASTLALTGLAGSRATTPDAASWAISPDLAVAVQFRSPMRTPGPGTAYEVYGQFDAAANRAWLLWLTSSGYAQLYVSTTGSDEIAAITTLPIPRPDAGPLTVAFEFDGDNGASGNTTTWYMVRGTIDDLLADKAAHQHGDPHTNSGTVAIFNSTATVGIGDVPSSGFDPYPGGIDRVYTRAGTLTSGIVVADADFAAEAAGTTSFADDAATPKTWTISGAEITDRKTRLLGTLDANDGAYPGQAVDGTAVRNWTIAGALRRMRQGAETLQSALYRRVNAPLTDTTVYAYWPLEDGRDATSIFTIGGDDGGVVAMSLAADSTLAASKPLPQVTGGQPFGWNLRCPPSAPVATWEMTMLVNIPVAPDDGAGEFIDVQRVDCTNGVTSQWVVRLDDNDWHVFAKDVGETPSNVLSASGTISSEVFGGWTIVTLSIGLSGSDITWTLDLIPIATGNVYGGSGTLASFGLPAGSPVGLRTLSSAAPQQGMSAGHFIVTSGAVAGWLAPADTAYAGEPDVSRVWRLCEEQGIPVLVDGLYVQITAAGGWPAALAAGAQAMGPQRPLSLLTLLAECAVVGNGLLGEARELLGLSYRPGARIQNQAARLSLTSEVTAPLTPTDDDRDVVNHATVSRPDGSSATYEATGDDAPGVIGLYEDTRTANVAADSDLAAHASWWVHEATWPEERYDTIPIELAKNDAKVADWHDLSVGDVIEATSLPAAETAQTLSQIVVGWEETISPHLWTLKANTRPAGPWEVGVLGDDARGKLDSATSVLDASFVAGTDTTMDVDHQTGRQWTTDSGEFPFDLDVGGAQVTATACGSPTGTVQTFTVSATIANGVTKTVPAGTAVSLWRPTVLAP